MKRRSFLAVAGVAPLAPPRAAGLISFAPPWTSPYAADPQYPHHLANREGQHLFLLNKTAWAYFGCREPQGFLARAKQQGITVIRAALEGRPYFPQLGIELWPWGGTREEPDWRRFAEPYWSEVERRIRLAGESGIGFDVVLYSNLHPAADQIGLHRPYWQRILERLGRYANVLTWEVANEYLENEAFQDAAGGFLAAHDPYHRSVCTSAGTTDDAAWPRKPWMGLAIVHTCTGSGPDWPLRAWYQSVARNVRAHDKPAFNNESGREKRHRNDDAVHRRKQAWTWCCCGAYWTWHSWEGCEGIDDVSYRGPGAEYLKPLSTFFQSVAFWRLDPNYTALQPADPSLVTSVLAAPDREQVIAYLCTEETGAAVKQQSTALRLPPGGYRVSFQRPADLDRLGEAVVQSTGLGRTRQLALPEFTDDLLVRIERISRGPAARIKGTE